MGSEVIVAERAVAEVERVGWRARASVCEAPTILGSRFGGAGPSAVVRVELLHNELGAVALQLDPARKRGTKNERAVSGSVHEA